MRTCKINVGIIDNTGGITLYSDDEYKGINVINNYKQGIINQNISNINVYKISKTNIHPYEWVREGPGKHITMLTY